MRNSSSKNRKKNQTKVLSESQSTKTLTTEQDTILKALLALNYRQIESDKHGIVLLPPENIEVWSEQHRYWITKNGQLFAGENWVDKLEISPKVVHELRLKVLKNEKRGFRPLTHDKD